MESEAMQLCSNCQREVSQANFTMHSIHCARNIEICPECKDPVPRSSFEEHKNEFHAIVACEECDVPVEKSKMNTHIELDCKFRKISCEFCQLDCLASLLEEHEKFCGSRTDNCSVCGAVVMVSRLADHEKSHFEPLLNAAKASSLSGEETSAAWNEEDVFLPCEVCGELFPMDVLALHQALCDVGEENAAAENRGWNEENDYQDLGAKPREPLNAQREEWNEYEKNEQQDFNYYPPTATQSYQNFAAEAVEQNSVSDMVPCEFCFQSFDYSFIAEHELSCPMYNAHVDVPNPKSFPKLNEDSTTSLDDFVVPNLVPRPAEQLRTDSANANAGHVPTRAKDKIVTLPDGSKIIKKPNTAFIRYVTKYENVNFLGSASEGEEQEEKDDVRATAAARAKGGQRSETGAIPKQAKRF